MTLDKELAAAAALADTSHLQDFEGSPVVAAAIEIPNAAGGFQDSMGVNPRAWKHGDEFDLVFHVKVRKVRHDLADPKDEESDTLKRVHVLHATSAAMINPEIAAAAIEAETKVIDEARAKGKAELDRIKGQERLVAAEGDDSKVNPKAKASKGGKVLEFPNDRKPSSRAVGAILSQLRRAELRELADKQDPPVEYTTRTPAPELVGALKKFDGIAEQAEKIIANR